MPKSYFTFDGLDSRDWNCYKTQPLNFPTPAKDFEEIEVPGRNGNIILDNGSYKNVEVIIDCYIDGDFIENFDRMRAYLMRDADYHRFEDSLYPDEYRLVSVRNVEATVATPKKGTIEITLSCKPQRFLKAGEQAIVYTPTSTSDPGFYTLSDFSEYTRSRISSYLLMFGYTSPAISAMEFIVAQITLSQESVISVETESSSRFFALVAANNPVTSDTDFSPKANKTFSLNSSAYIVFQRNSPLNVYVDSVLAYEYNLYDDFTLTNLTLYPAYPLIRMELAGGAFDDYLISINGCAVRFHRFITEYALTIDTYSMDAYCEPDDCQEGRRMSMNQLVTYTNYDIKLESGVNELLVTGRVSKLEIIPRWWRI